MPPRLRLRFHIEAPTTRSTSFCAQTSAPSRRAPLYRYSSGTIGPNASSPSPPPPPKRWLSELQTRLGKCITFGCSPPQVSRAADVLRALATEWRELLTGSEGFLTSGRRGLQDQQVVWGEMDSFGHVNNVVYFRYAEAARVNWITNFAVHEDPANSRQWAELMTPRNIGLIMKSLKADFKLPIVYPDTVSVYHKIRNRPASDPAPTSLVLDCIILSHRHRRVAATIEEDIAVYDYKRPGKTQMPSFAQKLLEKTFDDQEAETTRARQRIWGLIGEVEKLEKETWDREDAVEDMGSPPVAMR